MENAKEIIREIKTYKHDFYCNNCNKYIGSSIESDTGWYQKYGEFKLRFYIDEWYHISKCLCDDCKKLFIKKIKESLKNIGFEKW